jgi:hypothetical protein
MTQISPRTRSSTAAVSSIANSLDISIDRRIRQFLNGHSDGGDVLDVLYGDVAAEPVPARLGALLKR